MVRQVGGGIFGGAGGDIFIDDWRIDTRAQTGNNRFPVSEWKYTGHQILADASHSALWGFVGRRVVGYDWEVDIEAPYMYDYPLPLSMENYNGISFLGKLGANIGAAVAGYVDNDLAEQYIFAPFCFMEFGGIVVPGAPTDVMRVKFKLRGGAGAFYVPYQGDSAKNYMDYLNSQGWLPYAG